jgi:two-component system, OmpR family, sensor histidine kinase RstB
MRRQFVRVYAALFLVSLLVSMAIQMLALREIRQQVDQRLLDGFSEPVIHLRDRLAEFEDDPERMRAELVSLRRELGTRARILTLEAAMLSPEERAAVALGEPVLVREEGRRALVVSVGDNRVLLVGPFADRGRRGRLFLPVAMTGLTVLLIGAALYLLLRPIERRLHEITTAAARFGAGDMTVRAPTGHDDGIGRLGLQFNAMASQIAHLIDKQRHQLRAVSHELRTPLARVFFLVDEALEARTPREKDHALRRIEHSVHEMNELVEELLLFARLDSDTEEVHLEAIAVQPLFAEMVELARELKPSLEIPLTDDVGQFLGSPRYVRRALLNLVTNAARFAHQKVSLHAEKVGDLALLHVDDDGNGVPEASREAIFEPFAQLQTERNSHHGAGLGLAIVRRIVRAHGGDVTVTSSQLGGARFTLEFPLKARATTTSGSRTSVNSAIS